MDKMIRRRASEPEPSEALALVSGQRRIPPPLPYLPSDYEPSPDSPRHFIVSSTQMEPLTPRRQRAHSFRDSLLIEGSNSAREHFELVPYREWTVIAKNERLGQLVLFNQDSQSVTVQHYLNDYTDIDSNLPVPIHKEQCPFCQRPMRVNDDEHNYMDKNYFRLLASASTANTTTNSPNQSRSSTFSHEKMPDSFISQNLNENAFNQGYYSKFFIEMNKLGKGFRGSVFLCEHILDGVKLGKYAVKKVAIGDNHPWLVRMLREVHLLERLRHPNIVSYKHSWLEYNRLTAFGPEVPCLFILMECANGGNLEEYFEPRLPIESSSQSTSSPKTAKQLKRERIKRQLQEQDEYEKDVAAQPVEHVRKRLLSLTEILSLFLDIVQGLNHLHQQNIVHRDLKPPNLLLQYTDKRKGTIPRVLISDFGECEDLEENHLDSNRTGATGTLEFMAPEHVRLDIRGRNMVDYSPKADMWSLGMVLYYLCYSRLPYSVIDDVDILRQEILSFTELRFPKSRFDIYPPGVELPDNKGIESDIPNELKLLIRKLLSVDPSRRPSCSVILSQLQRLRNENGVFHEISANWCEEETDTKENTGKRSNNGHSLHKSKSVIKRQRLYSQPQSEASETVQEKDKEGDSIMTNHQDELLLLGMPDSQPYMDYSRYHISERHLANVLKTLTILLKVASCSYGCSPYSTNPHILYPVLILALLDFWVDSTTPSFILVTAHIVWIMLSTLVYGGLCQT
ncbi:kinase-like domain-containing protein [Pilobolus umbonatus]|nr:kinase-like domain-containing protein [Pilobolus umbonatus]